MRTDRQNDPLAGSDFSDTDLERIRAATRRAESKTQGEIRVVIAKDCRGPVRQFAFSEFYKHGLDNTADKTGVLILLVLHRQAIEIVADVGIDSKVPTEIWEGIVLGISNEIRRGSMTQGIVDAVNAVGAVLAREFPKETQDTNELSDKPIVEG